MARPMDGPLGEELDRDRSLDKRRTLVIRTDPGALLDRPPAIDAALSGSSLRVDPRAILRAIPKPGPRFAGRREK